ncbi:MAG: hypothetical protein KJZ68_05855 [Phycisphaerales bacterium]|nr:hypothetical protein [Phycisphaerales bacterium]
MAAFEQLGRDAKSGRQIVDGEAFLPARAQQGEDLHRIQVVLEHVHLVRPGVAGDQPGVLRDRLRVPLAGGQQRGQLADDAVGVVIRVDAADQRTVPPGQQVGEQMLTPENADARLTDSAARVTGGQEHHPVGPLVRLHEQVGLVVVDSQGLLGGCGWAHGDLLPKGHNEGTVPRRLGANKDRLGQRGGL